MKKRVMLILSCLLLSVGFIVAQTTRINGTVVDSNGEPVISASVVVKGTTIGTVTDLDGTFSINVPTGRNTLVFTLVGMKTLEARASQGMEVVMQNDDRLLEEIVVTGYGSARRAGTIVGSVSTVSKDVIEDKPTANVFDALQGKVAGMQVFTSNGEPSAVSSIKLRGVGSLEASSAPLFILDGAPVPQQTIMAMSPSDFESMSVLKDASATSIYGSRAANGVIMFTTKKGRRGGDSKPVITLKGQYTSSSLANTDFFDNLMNTTELLNFWESSGMYTSEQIASYRANYGNVNTKWQDYYYKDSAPTYETNLSISGGSEKLNYFFSLGYFDAEGLAARSNFKRYSVRSNVNARLNDWLSFGVNLGGGYNERETSPYGTNSTNRGLAMLAPPFYSPYDENGEEYYGIIPGWNRYSTSYLSDKNPYGDNRIVINGNTYLQVNPIENLTLKTQLALDTYDRRVTSKRLSSYASNLNDGIVEEYFMRGRTLTFTNTAEYRWNVANAHNFTALAGHEWIEYKYDAFDGSGYGVQDDRLTLLQHATSRQAINSSKSEYAYLSFFGRAEYNFNEKYFFDLAARNDQTSRFPKGNRSGWFYSVGGMWKMKSEDFLKDVSFLSSLDFKATYGTQGISEVGASINDNYNFYSLLGGEYYTYYDVVGTDPAISADYNGQSGWVVSKVGNRNMGWEKQSMFTVGLNAGMFNDRLRFEIEAYNKVNTDVLVAVPYPYTSGVSSIMKNTAKLDNRGIEFSVDVDAIKTNDLTLTPYLRISYNKQEIKRLFPEATEDGKYWYMPNYGVYWSVGNPVTYAYAIWAGVNSQTGEPQWYLPGDDPTVTTTDPSRVTSELSDALVQNTGKKYYAPTQGSFGLNASYKDFTLQADFTFQLGKYLINNDKYFFENPNGFSAFNQSKVVTDYWKEPGDEARFPDINNYLFTEFDSRLIENASFMRLKTLTLGYNIPKHLLNKTKVLSAVRVFAVGRNLFTVTDYTGPDPEVDNNLTLGVNPNTKQFSFGVEITF